MILSRALARALPSLAAAWLCAASPGRAAVLGVPAGATNPNGWFQITGTASPNTIGDAIHTMTFKIEVTGATLDVQVYDAGRSGARDTVRSDSTPTTYTLRRPDGTTLATTTINNDNGTTQDALARLTAAGFRAPGSSAPFAVQPGLYELTIATGGGTDVNGFGLFVPGYQVYTSTDVPGGAEDGQIITGPQTGGTAPLANITQPVTMYPYVDRGCSLTTTNYDDDFGGGVGVGSSGNLISRLGTTTALTMSGNGTAADDAVAFTQVTKAQDYGIWSIVWNSGTQDNMIDWRVADYLGVTIPGANLPHRPIAPFRIYLPADGSVPGAPVAPVEPRIEHSVTPLSPSGSSSPGGPNPPVVGQTSYFEVNVGLTNPTASAMTSVTLTANVPGGQVLYESSNPPLITAGAQVSGGGSVSSEPGDGGSGNVVATWATVNAGATVTLAYFIAVTPTGAGSINVNATPASGNGTRLVYTPAFQSVTYPRTENIGPLCQLSVQAGAAVPNAVALESLEARGFAGEVRLGWSTASEWQNLGFNVYRAEGAAGRFGLRNRDLILGAGTSLLRARYLFVDPEVTPGVTYAYLLEDVERTGKRTLHGPVLVTAGGERAPAIDPLAYDHIASPEGDLTGSAATGLSLAVRQPDPAKPAPRAPARVPSASALVDEGARALARVVSRDAAGLVVEIKVPAARLATVSLDGAPYTDVSIRGFSHIARPGHPALPEVGVPVEIEDVADVGLEVEELSMRRIPGPVLPAPAPEYVPQGDGSLLSTWTPDPGVYGGAAAYPEAAVSLAGSVRQGERTLVVLRVNPVRWNPLTGALAQATRLRARITYLGAAASRAAAEPDLRRTNQFLLASRGALRIAVDRTGVQRVSGQALLDAGLPADTDPRLLALYAGGREAAMHVAGEEDGVLDPEDALLFYGEPLDNAHALARTYWLLAGSLAGRRMASVEGAPSGIDPGETTTPASVRLEKNLVYVPFVLNGEVSNFVGDSIFQNPRDQMLTLTGVTDGEATLRVRIQGATSDSNVSPDHHLQVLVNGVAVGDARWDGFEAFEGSFPIPPGTLAEGANTVRLTPIADTGALYDFDYVDWVEIRYARSLGQAGSMLAFETSISGDHTLSGLSGPAALLLDVTDPLLPERIAGGVAGEGTLTFAAQAGTRRLLVATEAGFITPSSVSLDTPSALNAAPGTDWLAIAHASLLAGTQPLAALRASEGMRARVVDVQDVYDEFGSGDPDPQAIQDYLAWQYAQGGEPRLGYVLLVGDASYDERNWLRGPNRNLIPARLLDGTYTERASDNWYASFEGGDAVPDVALGRLPARDSAQLATVVSKIASYAAQPLGQDWQRSALLVADDGFRAFQAGEAAIFEGASDAMARWLPPGFDALKLYLSAIPEASQPAVVRQGIVDALNGGVLLATFFGHGGITLWADEVVFRSSDLPLVQNLDRLPLVVVLTCLNGFFNAPSGDSLGESMLSKPDGGAAAFFAPTSVSPIAGQEVMGEAIARALFREGHLRVGDALVQARLALTGLEYFEDLSQSWVLLGDPATTLAFTPVPIADAGEDRVLEAKSRVTLDGTGSGGVTGPLAFAWRLVSAPAGSRAAISKPDTATPEIRVDREGTYVVELLVSAGGRSSAPDALVIRALPRPGAGGGDRVRGSDL